MRQKIWLQKRGEVFYAINSETGRKESLQTRDRVHAERLVHAKNEAAGRFFNNISIAKAYLEGADATLTQRTWQFVMDEFIKQGTKESTRDRKQRALARGLFDRLRHKRVVETSAEDFREILEKSGVHANGTLRCLHNLARGMAWLPWDIIPPKLWPKPKTKPKRGLTKDEHDRIVAAECNVERKRYYETLWEIGSAQSDAANLRAENIDLQNGVLSFQRMKTGEQCHIMIGERLAKLLKQSPQAGLLFPRIQSLSDKHRAAEFSRRCRLLKIIGISLHSYRYAWAERAYTNGVPERFAQAALGHSSKAVHWAYAKNAVVKVPSLEEYETAHEQKKLEPVQFAVNG